MATTTTMSAKELGRLQRTMNELLQSNKMDEFRILLNQNEELIQTTREKGIITMVLRFAILNDDDARIASVFDRLSMKRDYFALMVYNPEPEYCAHLFTRYIDAALLDSKDIRFMIENRLTFLFRYLDGKFLNDSRPTCDGGELVESETSLSRYTLQGCEHYIKKIVAQIEKDPKNKSKQHLPVLKALGEIVSSTLYDAIIDGGKFDFAASGRFPNFTEPDPSYHGLAYWPALGAGSYIIKARVQMLRDLGMSASPFNAWSILQGVETLSLRMDRHWENAAKVVEFLQKQSDVIGINYAGLASSPWHERAKKYFGGRGFGSVIAVELKGGREAGQKFTEALQLHSHVANIGDVRSLVIHPASTTHSQLTEEEQRSAGVAPGLVRLSVGLEYAVDIIADLELGFAAIR